MLGIGAWKQRMPQPQDALPGRETAIHPMHSHHVTGRSLSPDAFPGSEVLVVGMGCFWGAERKFWNIPGVYTTSVGYAGGYTPNPTYREVCSGQTGHSEVVRVVYDPATVSLEALLRTFWESHDPTQGMRQGNDVGTQYRSAIYLGTPAQLATAEASAKTYQAQLTGSGYGAITTEIALAGPYYLAEDEHQQYLSKHPDGYCGLGGTGVSCPIGLGAG
ncbi:peptide-methionine (S)-S-oxide reductase MsrA [Dyella sp.]|uniref:peptide-methionine (S)-S-oxide reductase MsrA n=1 Tax=Dyella sp. TaxID=1869338 RepID=UPI002ED4DF4D